MLLQDKRINLKTLSVSAVFLAVSVILSFVEAISRINALIPLPGVKLGLCNIATTSAFYLVSKKSAFAIAVIRLFTVVSFYTRDSMCEREKGKEGERAHFLKLKKTVIIKIYHANPIRGLYYSDF